MAEQFAQNKFISYISQSMSSIICITITGKTRLINGRSSTEGIVQVFHQTKWGDICNDKWTLREANVVCKGLGLEPATFAIKRQMFASNYGRVKLLRGAKCMGNESFIGDCKHSGWVNVRWCYENVAGAVCGAPKRK